MKKQVILKYVKMLLQLKVMTILCLMSFFCMMRLIFRLMLNTELTLVTLKHVQNEFNIRLNVECIPIVDVAIMDGQTM